MCVSTLADSLLTSVVSTQPMKVRALLINRKHELGTSQQIILIDFDTQPRTRSYLIQLIGE